MRHDHQLAVQGQHLGDAHGRRPGVDDDRPAVRELVERDLRDPLLLPGEARLALVDRRLDPEPLHRDGAAVDAPQHTEPFERCQVASDGLGGDIEVLSDLLDLDATFAARTPQDLLVAFRGVHADFPTSMSELARPDVVTPVYRPVCARCQAVRPRFGSRRTSVGEFGRRGAR